MSVTVKGMEVKSDALSSGVLREFLFCQLSVPSTYSVCLWCHLATCPTWHLWLTRSLRENSFFQEWIKVLFLLCLFLYLSLISDFCFQTWMLIPVWKLERHDWLTANVVGNEIRLTRFMFCIFKFTKAQYRHKFENDNFSVELTNFHLAHWVELYFYRFRFRQNDKLPQFSCCFSFTLSLELFFPSSLVFLFVTLRGVWRGRKPASRPPSLKSFYSRPWSAFRLPAGQHLIHVSCLVTSVGSLYIKGIVISKVIIESLVICQVNPWEIKCRLRSLALVCR